ncbi:MAG: hypothetical protein RSB38_01555 [Oscillospiraceae bacterium]
MFCPKCKLEFRDGFDYCHDCECPLVDTLPLDLGTKPRPNEREKFLIEAVDEYEADMIVANLKCEGVFAFKRYKGSDSYNKVFLGRTILGVDIFVGESDYEEALNIIKY